MAKKIKQAPSTQISVIAEGTDEWGRRYFLLGEKGEPISFPPVLASRLISKRNEVIAELVNAGFGLFTNTAQNEFTASIQKWKKRESSFRVAAKIGWVGRSLIYVLPDKIFNERRNVYPLLELSAVTREKYRVSANDSLEQWQENIGKLCSR
jgi:hypothetical protein